MTSLRNSAVPRPRFGPRSCPSLSPQRKSGSSTSCPHLLQRPSLNSSNHLHYLFETDTVFDCVISKSSHASEAISSSSPTCSPPQLLSCCVVRCLHSRRLLTSPLVLCLLPFLPTDLRRMLSRMLPRLLIVPWLMPLSRASIRLVCGIFPFLGCFTFHHLLHQHA